MWIVYGRVQRCSPSVVFGIVCSTVCVTEKFPFRSRCPRNGDQNGNKTALKMASKRTRKRFANAENTASKTDM